TRAAQRPDRGVDQARILRQHHVGAEPQLLHRARPHVVHEHVRPGDLVHEPRHVLRVLEVERDPPLVRVHGKVRGRDTVPERWAPAARVVPLGALHLDHVRAHAGEDAGGEGAGERPAQFDHADPLERQRHLRPPERARSEARLAASRRRPGGGQAGGKTRRPPACFTMKPGRGKCAAQISTPESAICSTKASRVRAACLGSEQNLLDHWGSATCTTRCMRSPENTASPAVVVRRTHEWPGVWPWEGSKRRCSSTLKVSSTSRALPASITGATLSVKQPDASRPSSCSCFQNSNSEPTITYFAFGKVGTHLSFTSRVFQPTWSTCRWVQST